MTTATMRLPVPPALPLVLPVPGPVWGERPMRAVDDHAGAWRRPRRTSATAQARQVAAQAEAAMSGWMALDPAAHAHALVTLRRELRREGLTPALVANALGAVGASAQRTLGLVPRSTQCMAAAVLLDNALAEMATGEGKTLATGLAAAVGALAGMPVHVVTANEYLAGRDAAGLQPLFGALGLGVAHVRETMDAESRRAAYRAPIVYATAKTLAFDFLRDRQAASAGGGEVMRGLCMALVDEADSILLDEADVPLILSQSRPNAARRAFLWQALALARQLDLALHVRLDARAHQATLTAAGEQRAAELCAGLSGPWRSARWRREALSTALTGLHVMQRDRHYLVRDAQVQLLDEVTGRVAVGRVWSRGLHTVVELKEGLTPSADSETLVQTTYQRFFRRYWRLCGLSGTLWEARRELREVYGAPVVRVPLHRPSQRRVLPTRSYGDEAAWWHAVAARAAEWQAQGRPVLIGTDDVEASEAASRALAQAGVAHRVLNARQDADEAAIVAGAGRHGAVTVATRMAGRGTDIELDDAARAAGGLHVLACQHNPSARLDRQLAGRAARHGDPGSVEAWHLTQKLHPLPQWAADILKRWNQDLSPALIRPAWGLRVWLRIPQWMEERRRQARRRTLLQQDLDWERRLSAPGRPR